MFYYNYQVNRCKQLHNELVQRERLLEWKKNLETRADNTVTINLRNYTNRNKFYNNRLRIDILRV